MRRCVGIDIAKTGWSAIGLVVDGEPTRYSLWKPENDKDTAPTMLVQYEKWIKRTLWIYKPDIVSVAKLAVFMRKETIRALSHHEGVALLTAKKSGAFVVNPSDVTARKIALGKGAGKDEAWTMFKAQYDFKLPNKTNGGMDVMDALTQALAAPTVLERG